MKAVASLNQPVGNSVFLKIRQQNGYYVDKTAWIKSIFNDGGQVSLYTRPRRFGKTLMLTTLRAFFEMDYADPQCCEGVRSSVLLNKK